MTTPVGCRLPPTTLWPPSSRRPPSDVIEEQAQQALSLIADKVRIQWVWLPPWGPDKITPEGREQLRALGFNV